MMICMPKISTNTIICQTREEGIRLTTKRWFTIQVIEKGSPIGSIVLT